MKFDNEVATLNGIVNIIIIAQLLVKIKAISSFNVIIGTNAQLYDFVPVYKSFSATA